MAYIRKKGRYSYLVESYRDDSGKPRQKVLTYLGAEDEVEQKLTEARAMHPEWFNDKTVQNTEHPIKTIAEPWDRRRD
jgi:hypothetical protein